MSIPCVQTPLPSVKISSLILTEGRGGSVHALGVKGRDS